MTQLILFLSGLLCSVLGALLGMYTWAAVQAEGPEAEGVGHSGTPLEKHFSSAAAPLLYLWGLGMVFGGVLLLGVGLEPIIGVIYRCLAPWPAGWRLLAVVLLSTISCYAGTLPLRIGYRQVSQLLGQTAREQRLKGRDFALLAVHTVILWCSLVPIALAVVLTDQLSQKYP